MTTEYTISTGALLKIAAFAIVLYILYQILDVLAVLFLAVVIASALEPVILYFKAYRVPRVVTTLVMYLIAFFGLAVIFYLLLPPLVDEAVNFAQDFPRIQERFLQSDALESLPFYPLISENINALSNISSETLNKVGGSFLAFTSEIVGGVFSLILLIIISFYLAVQENGIDRFLQAIMPLRYEKYALEVWTRARKKLATWLQTMFVLMAIVGTLVYLSLSFVGIKYAFLLGVLSGLFEIIPLVGPILAAVPGVILGMLVSPSVALIVLVIYVVIQQVENHVIVPLLMQKAMGLNPIVIILALLIGGNIGGVLGLLVAVPLATVIVEIVDDLDRRRRITA